MTCTLTSLHGPVQAKYRNVESGNFGTIVVGDHPAEISILIVASPGNNMIFLQQLRYAVEMAIRDEMER